MQNLKYILLISSISLLIVSSSAIIPSNAEPCLATTPVPLIKSSGILLDSDSALDTYCAGNTTTGLSWATAHIIENLEINTTLVSGNPLIGIDIRDTTRYLIIRNCVVLPNTAAANYVLLIGIKLTNCHNVRIEFCQVNGQSWGIYIAQGDQITIKNCSLVTNSKYQTYIWDPQPYPMYGAYGLYIQGATAVQVTNNTISNNDKGGILIEGAQDSLFSYNSVVSNGNASVKVSAGQRPGGIILKSGLNNTFWMNKLSDNAIQQAFDDTSGGAVDDNYWDNQHGVGNYWGDFSVRYPNAMKIAGGYLYNQYYYLNGTAGTSDNYPLVYPFKGPQWEPNVTSAEDNGNSSDMPSLMLSFVLPMAIGYLIKNKKH